MASTARHSPGSLGKSGERVGDRLSVSSKDLLCEPVHSAVEIREAIYSPKLYVVTVRRLAVSAHGSQKAMP